MCIYTYFLFIGIVPKVSRGRSSMVPINVDEVVATSYIILKSLSVCVANNNRKEKVLLAALRGSSLSHLLFLLIRSYSDKLNRNLSLC